MDDYLAGLDRAMKKMPATRESKERFVIPSVKVFYEGKTTVLENFGAIADTLNRDPEHLMKYLLQEMGTAGKIEGAARHLSGKVRRDCHRPPDRVLLRGVCGLHRVQAA